MKKRKEEAEDLSITGIEYDEKAAEMFEEELKEEKKQEEENEIEEKEKATNSDEKKVKSDIENLSKIMRRLLASLDFIYQADRTKQEITDFYIENGFSHSTSTLSRDVELFEFMEFIKSIKYLGKTFYRFTKQEFGGAKVTISKDEYQAFRILKNQNKTFVSSQFLGYVESIERKLEHFLTDRTVINEPLNLEELEENDIKVQFEELWSYMPGIFDYKNSGSTIYSLLRCIIDRSLIRITYQIPNEEQKSIQAVPVSFYVFDGNMYIILYYNKIKKFMSLTLQFINAIETIDSEYQNIPDLDLKKYLENRFGVFEQEPKKVTLSVKKEYVRYFENRQWHPSQYARQINTGDMIIEMNVPLTPEFVAWIIKWTDAITVVEPHELIVKVKEGARRILANYEK